MTNCFLKNIWLNKIKERKEKKIKEKLLDKIINRVVNNIAIKRK
jgi:hypothetical protein